jgi:hypothetical protein
MQVPAEIFPKQNAAGHKAHGIHSVNHSVNLSVKLSVTQLDTYFQVRIKFITDPLQHPNRNVALRYSPLCALLYYAK